MIVTKPSSPAQLLSLPDPATEVSHERATCSVEVLDEPFLVHERNFSHQFAHIYTTRLTQLRTRLEGRVRKKWGENVMIKKLFELDENSETCVIIGTLVKDQQLRPSILREISEEHSLQPQMVRERFVHDSDTLVLEDELQRIKLIGGVDPHFLVTGIVCAVYGQEEEGGKFTVKDICFPSVESQIQRPIPEEDRFVVLLSGIGLTTNCDMFPLQLLVDLLTGELGSPSEQENLAKVVRVIVAGNSVAASTQDKDSFKKARYLTRDTEAGSVEAIRELDAMLAQLVGSVNVDLMPGEFDPANHLIPQQPLHHCMFPKAGIYPTLHSVTNPHHCIIGGRQLLGTSGQNVKDIYRYSGLEDPLVIMEKLLTWGHLAPTAPDTLNCYPYYDRDPFLLQSCPHVFYAGNQKKFATKMFKSSGGQEVCLISIPSFAETSTAILLNLRTLHCQPIVVHTALTSQISDTVDK